MTKSPWYSDGLKFKCTECGGCCTGEPGYVWISEEEIVEMASYLELDLDTFSKKYLRKVNNRWSLREKPANHDCVFLDGKRCTVYPVRPSQCKTFPWWPQNVETPAAWKRAANSCEGISDDAPIVPLEIINEQLN